MDSNFVCHPVMMSSHNWPEPQVAKVCMMKHDNELGKVTAGAGSNCQEQYRNPGFWWRGGRPTTESWGIHKPHLPGRPKKLSDEQALKAAKLFDEAYKQLRTGLTLHFICSSVNEEIGVTVFEIRISHGFGQVLWSVKRDSVAFRLDSRATISCNCFVVT